MSRAYRGHVKHAALLIAAAFITLPAFADTSTKTCTIAQTGAPYTLTTCTLDQFNPALGTLTNVVLALSGVGGSVAAKQFDFSDVADPFVNSTGTVQLTFKGPDSIETSVVSTPACMGTVGANGTNTCTATTFSGASAPSVTAASVTPYIGTGTLSFTATGQIDGTGAGGRGANGELGFGGTGSIGGTLTLTYTYTPPAVLNGYDYLVSNSTTPGSLTTSTTGTPVAGTTVALTGTDTFSNPVSETTTTDASGFYSFTNLNASNSSGYTVTETPPASDSHLGQTSTTTGAVTNTPPVRPRSSQTSS